MNRFSLEAHKIAALAIVVPSLAALFVSCWSPYYDPKVSNSVPFYEKIGAPFLSIGPISSNSGSSDPESSLEFLPSRPSASVLDPVDGFIVQKSSRSVCLGFIELYNGSYRMAPSKQNMTNILGWAALARSEATNGNPQLVVLCDNANARQYSFDPATHQLSSANTPISGSTSVLGLGANLLTPPTVDTDSYAVLFSDGAQNLVAGADIDAVAFGPFANLVASTLDMGGRSLSAGGSAFLDAQNNRFYYSAPGGPTLLWDASTWPGSSSPPTVLPISQRLTAMLSDGTLVAQNDTYMTAYSAAGAKLFSIPTGSVRLEQEVYAGIGNFVLFSQVLVVNGSGNQQLYINVWRYPLARFRSLGG